MSLFKRSSGPITDSANFLDTGGGGLLLFNAGPMPSNAPPTAFERGLTRDDPSNIGLNDPVRPEEQQQPSDLEGEDSPFDIVFQSLFGTQGIPAEVDPRILRALTVANETQNDSELNRIKEEIDAAGGYDKWLASQQQEESTSIFDVVEGATEAVTEGVSSAVQDAITAARDALSDDASDDAEEVTTAGAILDWIAENVPEITPQSIFDEYIGAGVGVNLPTGAPIGSGTVFVPGIPGLPSSSPNMVIGTVDEVMQDILDGNLPGVLGDIAEDPVGGIQAVVGGAVDDAEEVTAGDLLGDVDLLLGDDEGIDSVFDEPGQRTDYGGGLNDGESEDILAGVGGATAAAGTAGVQKPSGDFTPFMKRLDYRPVAIPEAVVPSLFREYFT